MLRRALIPLSLLAAMGLSPATAQDAPARVVSMNLCTDQLAMLLAAPGQLLSVSKLARDPMSSAMADAAMAYPVNHGQAEEVWLMQPDLVIVGSYTAQAAAQMLERLGTRVQRIAPATSLADVPARLRTLGEAMGRQARAEALIAEFETRLAALREKVDRRPSAALYYANGYTTGDQTLAGEILLAAGFDNIAGARGGGQLPLEALAMAQPEALITARPYPGASRSEEILMHPVVRQLRAAQAATANTGTDWICGTPFVLQAIEELSEFRKALETETE
ncbi:MULTISPECIES: ABC transporter substrate-binding protein [unclassified Salipiger]|uniref:ABC transporter substrate-binding protein n=1 Tax=unclassified Salipiger TaxID=2640570 RepID=UPI0013BB56F5|nr:MULTISPECIES: ABC transporter substrate-binding protein [unclassified Salipiger]NDV48566.1 ABC transporter substrate-binding protein [Salipiger sp. PrR003]NDW30653.1 ABC transporter substrate-binding protein [Salipiger sp. PrR007]